MSAATSSSIRVEVAYALPERQTLRELRLPEASTVADAIRASGLLEDFPDLDAARVGIFGRAVRPDARLSDGDRVEIYRPLVADPKEARRKRAAAAKRK